MNAVPLCVALWLIALSMAVGGLYLLLGLGWTLLIGSLPVWWLVLVVTRGIARGA